MNHLKWLESWYQSKCDGVWEHTFGIKIETLDNPGWLVKIDLSDTKDVNVPARVARKNSTDTDWIHCVVDQGQFSGYGVMRKSRGKAGSIIEVEAVRRLHN